MKLAKNKKAVITQFLPLVTAIVAFGITIAIGFLILAELADNATISSDTNASKAVDTVQSAMSDIPGWLPIVIVAIIGALLLSLVSLFRTS